MASIQLVRRLVAAGAVTAIVAGCNTQAGAPGQMAPPAGQCFLPSQVNGFQPVDADTVNVFVGPSDVYSLDLTGTCMDVDWSTQIGIRSTGGMSWVCQGYDAELLVPGPGGGMQRCPVTNVQQLSPEAAQAARSGRGS